MHVPSSADVVGSAIRVAATGPDMSPRDLLA